MDNAEYLLPYLETIDIGVCPACLSNKTGMTSHKQNTIHVIPFDQSWHKEYHSGDKKSDRLVVCEPCVEKREAKRNYLSVLSALLDKSTLTTTCTTFHNTTFGDVTLHPDTDEKLSPIKNTKQLHPTKELQDIFDFIVYSPLKDASLGVKENREAESGIVYHFQTGLMIGFTDDWSFEGCIQMFGSADWNIVQNEQTIPYLL